MGIIRREIEIFGLRKSKKILALFDSGAYWNYLSPNLDEDTPDDIGFHVYEGQHDAILANQEIASGESVRFKKVLIENKTIDEPRFIILKQMLEHAIIGADTMQKLGIYIDFVNDRLVI